MYRSGFLVLSAFLFYLEHVCGIPSMWVVVLLV